jgi:hypothetical protein
MVEGAKNDLGGTFMESWAGGTTSRQKGCSRSHDAAWRAPINRKRLKKIYGIRNASLAAKVIYLVNSERCILSRFLETYQSIPDSVTQ